MRAVLGAAPKETPAPATEVVPPIVVGAPAGATPPKHTAPAGPDVAIPIVRESPTAAVAAKASTGRPAVTPLATGALPEEGVYYLIQSASVFTKDGVIGLSRGRRCASWGKVSTLPRDSRWSCRAVSLPVILPSAASSGKRKPLIRRASGRPSELPPSLLFRRATRLRQQRPTRPCQLRPAALLVEAARCKGALCNAPAASVRNVSETRPWWCARTVHSPEDKENAARSALLNGSPRSIQLTPSDRAAPLFGFFPSRPIFSNERAFSTGCATLLRG
jgi:hypothetical protein